MGTVSKAQYTYLNFLALAMTFYVYYGMQPCKLYFDQQIQGIQLANLRLPPVK